METINWTLLTTVCLFSRVYATHFRGATISWKPSGNTTEVIISFRISWRRSYSGLFCEEETKTAGDLIGPGDMMCLSGCTGRVGTMAFQCTDFSTEEDWSSGRNAYSYTFPSSDAKYYQFGFTGTAWIDGLQSGGGNWVLRTTVNLTAREDTGRLNSPPSTDLPPIVRLQHMCNHTIRIPVTDDDGDVIRCRWAESAKDECGGICGTFNQASLDGGKCEIRYSANESVGWYAVAIQIEDFDSESATEPMSSIPLQFLVQVFESVNVTCATKPAFVEPTRPDESCIGVPFGSTYSELIIARSDSPDIGIAEIQTASPIGMAKSPLTQYEGTTDTYYINVTWSPTQEQAGVNIFCYQASDDNGFVSDRRCIKLVVGVAPPTIVEGSQSPTGDVLPDQGTWQIKFDAQFQRPTRPTYIRFFELGGTLILPIDVSTSNDVTYPDGALERTLMITGPRNLVEKQRYYILLESGVVNGMEFCGPESPAITDKSFWTFRVRDVTPPVLLSITVPDVSNANASVTWTFNEAVKSVCTLQSPTETLLVNCTDSWLGTDLHEGIYTIFITATDLEGNVGAVVRRSWSVDLTPPVLTIGVKPSAVSNKTTEQLQFSCNERCTFECRVYETDNVPSGGWQTCHTGVFTTSTLTTDTNYVFQAKATDGVGNEGSVVSTQWQTDFNSPTFVASTCDSISTVSVQCGDPFSPNETGTPQVSDTIDPAPTLTYTDAPLDQCGVQRTWVAKDEAGNKAVCVQSITFQSAGAIQVTTSPASAIVACGELDDVTETFENSFVIVHPCGLSVSITYTDGPDANKCGVTFIRTWEITDTCGSSITKQQNIQILEVQNPISPDNGQDGVPLRPTLRWSEYGSASSFNVYLWIYQTDRPMSPMSSTGNTWFVPPQNLVSATRYLWQIEFVLSQNDSVLGPKWGFETRKYPDLVVETVDMPPVAYTGQTFQVSWTVKNIGKLGTQARYWYDYIYLSAGDFDSARYVGRVFVQNIIFPDDGYTERGDVELGESEFGTFYVFVQTNRNGHVNELETDNNLRRSSGSIDAKLTPPPDLVVESVNIPSSSFSGQEISVAWGVKNVGTGTTEGGVWYDTLWWSHDEFSNTSDTLLKTVRRTGNLAPAEMYNVSTTVTVPRFISGQFYILVKVDQYDQVFEYVNDDNNIKASETTITVTLTPPADLEVTELNVPSEVTTGDSMRISWTVFNSGSTEPYSSYWIDRLVLTSQVDRKSTLLTNSYHWGRLAPDVPYSSSLEYTIAAFLTSGLYNVTLTTDVNENVFEYQTRGNNILTKQTKIIQSLPNLVPVSLTVDVTEFDGTNILNISWRVRNDGAGRTLVKDWKDGLWVISPDSSIFRTKRLAFIPVSRDTYLNPSIEYQEQHELVLPPNIYGNLSVMVEIDDGIRRVSETDITDNSKTSESFIVPLLAADIVLILENTKVLNIVAGETVEVVYNFTNEGTSIAEAVRWNDRIVISSSSSDPYPILASAVKLQSGPLDSNVVNTSSVSLSIPEDLAGTFYVHFSVDDNQVVFEGPNKNNNKGMVEARIRSPPTPDLQVSYVYARLMGNSENNDERLLRVSWAVSNFGNTMPLEKSWSDSISFSPFTIAEADPANLNFLASFQVRAALQSQGTYEQSKVVALPSQVEGTIYIYFQTDIFSEVNEGTAELNNLRQYEHPISVDPSPKPSLSVSVSVEPLRGSSFYPGGSITVNYTVENEGERDTYKSSWVDSIFIYTGPPGEFDVRSDKATKVSDITRIGILGKGGHYDVETTILIPFGIEGSISIFVVPDYTGDDNVEPGTDGDSIGLPADSDPIVVESPVLPNLQVTSVQSLSTQISGQPFSLRFNVTNTANGSVLNTWYSALYLSEDFDFDVFDTKLGSSISSTVLDASEYYENEIHGFLPYDLESKSYYFIVQLDSINTVYETDETDNTVKVPVLITEATSTDLAVVNVVAPSSVVFGGTMPVSWSLLNNGSLEATGYKCDSVYISDDSVWDISDEQIGNAKCGFITIPPVASDADGEQFTITEDVPLVAAGAYTAIVKTRSNIRDGNLGNNIGFSPSTTDVNVETLLLDVDVTKTLPLMSVLAFLIVDVAEGETLIVNINAANKETFNNMYVKYGSAATLFDYDTTTEDPLQPDQNVLIPNTFSGDYYLLITNSGSIDSSDTNVDITIHAKLAVFELIETFPKKAAPLGQVTLKIRGTLIPTSFTALLKNGDTEILATDIYSFSSILAYATFDIKNTLIGTRFTLKLITGLSEATYPDALEIISGSGGQVKTQLTRPGALRAGDSDTVTLDVVNTGDTDILVPIIRVLATGNGHMRLHQESKATDFKKDHIIVASPTQGPGGILPPRAFSRLIFDVKQQDPNIASSLSIQVATVDPRTDSRHWLYDVKDLYRPSHYRNSTWEKIWNIFISHVGTTTYTLNQKVSELANEFSKAGRRVLAFEDYVLFLLEVSENPTLENVVIWTVDSDAPYRSGQETDIGVERYISASIAKQSVAGVFGKGWIVPLWDTYILNTDEDSVTLAFEQSEVIFLQDLDEEDDVKVYRNPGLGILEKNSTDFVFTHAGYQTTFVFNSDTGYLKMVSSSVDKSHVLLLHDSNGSITSLHHSSGQTIAVAYDASNRISSLTLSGGSSEPEVKTLYEYDDERNVLTSVTSGNEVTTYQYYPDDILKSVNYPEGNKLHFEYTRDGFLAAKRFSASDEYASATEYHYNGVATLSIRTSPDSVNVYLTYNERKEVIAMRRDGYLDERTITTQNSRTVYEGSYMIVRETTDRDRNAIQIEDANFDRTELLFDQYGRIMSYVDGNGNTFFINNNEDGRLASVIYPDGSNETRTYAAGGYEVMSPNATLRRYETNANGLVTLKDIGYDRVTSYSYDSENRLSSASNEEGSITTEYENEFPAKVTGPDGVQVSFTYTAAGDKKSIQTSDGYSVEYSYDKSERIVKVSNPVENKSLLLVTYNSRGLLSRKTLGNGAYVEYFYDDTTNLLTSLYNYKPDGTVLSMFKYKYDTRQRKIALETLQGNWTFRYDPSGQLVYFERPDGVSSTLTYDKAKNRKTLKTDGTEKLYVTNNMNQYESFGTDASFQHDKSGNLLKKDGLRKREFEYDGENKLIGLTTGDDVCRFSYDAYGNLYKKSCLHEDSRYVLDPYGHHGANVLTEYVQLDNETLKTDFFYGGDQLGLIAMKQNDDYFYFQFDPIGSVIDILNENGRALNTYEYDPFGNILSSNEEIHNHVFKYVGQWGVMHVPQAEEIYYMRSRFYDAEHGRFLSLDNFVLNARSTNFYVYAFNNPVHFKDPNGKIIPAIVYVILRKAAIGGVKNVIKYSATSYLKGDFSWGGAAGAFIEGAVDSVLPKSVKFLGKLGIHLAKAAAKTVANAVKNWIDGKEQSWTDIGKDLFKNIISDPLFDKLREKLPKDMQNWLKWYDRLCNGAAYIKGLKSLHDKLCGLMDFLKDKFRDLLLDFLRWILSRDPNDILGPPGYGSAHFIAKDIVLNYKIRFENDGNATAPAQRVYVDHIFDSDIDPRTFRIGSFGFGSFTKELNMASTFEQSKVNLTEESGVFVRVVAGLDLVNGKATWEFQSLDPETGSAPDDPRIGFLPPNNGTTGQGYVTFSVKLKRTVKTLARIDANATIYFDENEPIETPPIFNTVDDDVPTVNATVINEALETGTLTLSFNKADVGSGVRAIDVYQRTASGYDLLVTEVNETSVNLDVPSGAEYELVSVATDNVGNKQDLLDIQTVLLVNYSVVAATCECSENGQCSVLGICTCNEGYFGTHCNETSAPVEPPVLNINANPGLEDEQLQIFLSAQRLDGSSDGLLLDVSNFPDSSTFNKGRMSEDKLLLESNDFGEVDFEPPENWSGNVVLNIEAVDAHANVSRTGKLTVSIQPVVDGLETDISGCINATENKAYVDLGIKFLDGDGSESIDNIQVSLPDGYVLEDGESLGGYIYDLSVDYANDTLSISSSKNSTEFNISVVMSVTENLAGSETLQQAFTGKIHRLCVAGCTDFKWGENCESECLCNQTNALSCESSDGSCVCTPQWMGNTCETDVNECDGSDDLCESKPNTDCINIDDGYLCRCKPGYTEENGSCIEKLCQPFKWGDDCDQDCQCNQSNAINCSKAEGRCTCTEEWTGETCDVDVNECLLRPDICSARLYTECNNLDGTYECVCKIGFFDDKDGDCTECPTFYWGQNCSNECGCEKDNAIGCSNTDGTCDCLSKWTGPACTEDANECTSGVSVCENQTNTVCQNRKDGFDCMCKVGYTFDESSRNCIEQTLPQPDPKKDTEIKTDVEISVSFDFGNDEIDAAETNERYRKEVYNILYRLYRLMKAFRRLFVYRPRRGSLIISHSVYTNDSSEAKAELTSSLANLATGKVNLDIFNVTRTVNSIAVNDKTVKIGDSANLCDVYEAVDSCGTYQCEISDGTPVCRPRTSETPLALIIGASVGGAVLIILLIVAICCIHYRRKKHKKLSHELANPRHSTHGRHGKSYQGPRQPDYVFENEAYMQEYDRVRKQQHYSERGYH